MKLLQTLIEQDDEFGEDPSDLEGIERLRKRMDRIRKSVDTDPILKQHGRTIRRNLLPEYSFEKAFKKYSALKIKDPNAANRYMHLILTNPEHALKFAEKTGKRNPAVERVVIQDPTLAANYAARVIRGPWPEAESTILQNPSAVTTYATRAYKGESWTEGEQAALKSPRTALNYARAVKQQAWPEAEQLIESALLPKASTWSESDQNTHRVFLYEVFYYIQFAKRTRWDNIEPVFLQAFEVEANIRSHDEYYYGGMATKLIQYLERIGNKPWPEFETVMLQLISNGNLRPVPTIRKYYELTAGSVDTTKIFDAIAIAVGRGKIELTDSSYGLVQTLGRLIDELRGPDSKIENDVLLKLADVTQPASELIAAFKRFELLLKYATKVYNGQRWVPIEQLIQNNRNLQSARLVSDPIFKYINEVAKQRVPTLEPFIFNNPTTRRVYGTQYLGGNLKQNSVYKSLVRHYS